MKGLVKIGNRYNMLRKGCFFFGDMPVCLKNDAIKASF